MIDLFPNATLKRTPATARPSESAFDASDPGSDTPHRWHWLSAALDEVDYGMLLLVDDADVLHVNHAARMELDSRHPLVLSGSRLQARQESDAGALRTALRDARVRGLRKLLTLGGGAQSASVSIVPLSGSNCETNAPTLLILGKREVCGELSVQSYARTRRLTLAEGRVLDALCKGDPPAEIATRLGVSISTIRTQIGSIRVKTGAQSIRGLVRQVSVLPPLMGALRRTPNEGAFA